MPEMRIEAGAEPVEVAHGTQDGTQFSIKHLKGGRVHLDHNYRDVRNNPRRVLTQGDEGTLERVRGGVFAYAPDRTVTLRVGENDGFTLNLFGTKTVERARDRAARTGIQERASAFASSAGNDTVESEVVEFTGDSPAADAPIDVDLLSVNAVDPKTDDMRLYVDIYDSPKTGSGAGNIIATVEFPNGGDMSNMDPSVRVPQGGEVWLTAINYTANTPTVFCEMMYRVSDD